MRIIFLLFLPLLLFGSDVKVQILGSGGPELDERASASYLIWVDGKAKVLIDFGGGAFARLGEAKAQLEDIDAILFTHFHIDHVADFAALVKASYFSNIHKVIQVFGPSSSYHFPDTKSFLDAQFKNANLYGYMSDALDTHSKYISFKPHVFSKETDDPKKKIAIGTIDIELIAVTHGNVPALAYKVTVDGKGVVFSGDTSATTDNLITLAHQTDLLIAHHAIPQHAHKAASDLHMTPSRIGEIASKAKVKKVVLGHRMQRTIGREEASINYIKKHFKGEILLAEDLLMIPLTK